MTGKWRFELFYFDYSFGVLICATIALLTLGMLNPQEITAFDNFALAGYRKMGFGLAGGIVFNLANMLLVAAISITGMAVAFPVGIGLALVIGVIWNYLLNPQGHPAFLFGGSALVLAATIVDAWAFRRFAQEKTAEKRRSEAARMEAAQAAAGTAPKRAAMRRADAPKTAQATPVKGLILSIAAGILMGSFYPLVELGKEGDLALGPYPIAFVFALGVFLSTFIFNIFFSLMPVAGEPVALWDYFRGTPKQHLLGLAGGIIWMVGAVANFSAASVPPQVQVGPAVSYALGQGATMVSALWGLLVWKEFAGASSKVKQLLVIMMALFVAGLTLVSLAPLYARG